MKSPSQWFAGIFFQGQLSLVSESILVLSAMKKILPLFILPLSIFLALSCAKEETDIKPEGCSLTTIQNIGGSQRTYIYGTDGLVKTIRINESGFNTRIEITRKASGELESSLWYFESELAYKEKYTYENGRIVKTALVNPSFEAAVWGIHQLKYDEQGRLAEYTTEFGDPESDARYLYEYNEQGIQIRYETRYLDGRLQYKQIIKPAGTIAKSAESFLLERGLPYELPYGYAYPTADPGIGSVMDVYGPDSLGREKLLSTFILKTRKTNGKDFAEQIVWNSEGGDVVTNYVFNGCD